MLTETRMQPSFLCLLAALNRAPTRTLVQHPPAEPALYDRAEAILERSSREFVPLPYLGAMPLFGGHRVYEGQRFHWLLINLAEDPLFHDRDGFPVPGRVLRHLWALKTAGIEFDALYVAHEMEKGSISPGEPLTTELLMPPPSKPVAELSDRLGGVGETLWAIATAPLKLAAAGSALVGAGAVLAVPVVAMAVVACMAGDPILLGTVTAPGKPVRAGEPACWFHLGQWAYGAET